MKRNLWGSHKMTQRQLAALSDHLDSAFDVCMVAHNRANFRGSDTNFSFSGYQAYTWFTHTHTW